jgi:hypothetical protein
LEINVMAKKKAGKVTKKAVAVAKKKLAKKKVAKTKKAPKAKKLIKRDEVTGNREQGYVCGTCGKYHPELPMGFSSDAPYPYLIIPAKQRKARCHLTSALCVIDGKEFFIRGCLEIPVVDGPRPFVWVCLGLIERNEFQASFRTVGLR